MKGRWFILLLLSAVQAPAGTRDVYTWRAPLVGTWSPGSLYTAPIPPALLDGSQAFPGDLRIFDENDRDWPFYVAVHDPTRAETPWDVRVVEQAVPEVPVRYLRYTVELQPRRAGVAARHDRAVVTMAGHNYVRRFEVLGRAGGEEWNRVGEGYLIDQPGDPRLDNRIVTYEATSVTQLQFRIYPSPHAPAEALSIRGLTVLSETRSSDEGWLEVRQVEVAAPEKREGIQTLWCDVGFHRVPLAELKLEVVATEQACPVKVYGRPSPTNAWRWISDGGVHRLGGQVRNTIDLRQADFRYLKIDLYHYEQPPMTVTAVRVRRELLQLVFEADYGQQPFVYFGAAHHPLPRYDLQRRLGPDVPAQARPAAIGERGRNPARIAATLGRYGRTLAVSIVGVLAGLGVLVLVNLWRRKNA